MKDALPSWLEVLDEEDLQFLKRFVLSSGSLKALCDEGLVSSILVTDTIPCTLEIRESLPCLQVIPSTSLAADIVYRLNNELPLSPLLAPFNADDYLKK